MTVNFDMVPLADLLIQSNMHAEIDPDKSYQHVTVKLWGKGVELRNEVDGASIADSKLFVVRENQFILSKIDARNGAFGLIPSNLDKAVVSGDFPVFTPNISKIIPEYLKWLSKTSDFVQLCVAASEGTTNRVRLKIDRFLATKISLPSLEEQRRIVARIEELATKIEEARGMRRGVEEETESLITSQASALIQATNSQKTELNQWLDTERNGIQTGPFGAQLSSADFIESGRPVLTIGNIQYTGLNFNDLKYVSIEKSQQLNRFALKPGDILFARMGTVGRCCIVPAEAEGWLINYHIIRVALDNTKVDSRYIYWNIRASIDVKQYLEEEIRGATRQGVNSSIVGSLPMRVPSIAKQKHIVTHLSKLQSYVNSLKQKQAETSAELDALLPSILDKAFKGEL